MEECLREYIAEIASLTEKELEAQLIPTDPDHGILQEAMRYSACGGGKRVRPFLCVAVSDMLGGERTCSLPLAVALEMVHTYSLIHDDLPCMDNDALRRGRPTCHIRFGESTAMLAGDGLLTRAFEVITDAPSLDARQKVAAVSALSHAAGADGMIAGQIMDLAAEHGGCVTREKLEKLQGLKTGAMIRCAVRLGVIAARTEDKTLADALDTYASRVGLAFQVVDDYLDVCGDTAVFGKTVGSDAEQGKTTFATLLTPEKALAYAESLTRDACEVVRPYDKYGILGAFAGSLLYRKS